MAKTANTVHECYCYTVIGFTECYMNMVICGMIVHNVQVMVTWSKV